ncbi:hypothetical protein L596_003237 [Steinernema carpocapsae]|uniref:Uncharacterized protein n=1 Tax=Steinernema carpocapsae TaxID=34508 RepID=A0A4U8UTI6_STECR|nr:hypothetical protein L596_003237 [Steinernema carpocapsae]
MALPSRKLNVCECHKKDFPPWTGELHGVTQALQSNSPGMKIFWWLVVFSCVVGGTATTVLVIIEYLNGPTATSTTIRLVTTLKLPAVTICPKIPDAFNFTLLYTDMKTFLPSISEEGARDLIRFWLGGNGLENMDDLSNYNRSYLDVLSEQYKIWSKGYSQYGFFEIMQNQYGYKCEDLFFWCQLGGKQWDCCSQLFRRQVVMRRGICYQTMPSVNQTEPDDVGRLVVSLKAPSSVTSPHYNYTQPQLLIYVTDNHEFVVDYPRYYLYPHEWNRMRFTARFIELLPHPHVCTDQKFGKDAACFVRRWLLSNIGRPYNCTLVYMPQVPGVPPMPYCNMSVLAKNYYDAIQLVLSGAKVTQECVPGCKRWDYQISLQQTEALQPFKDYVFNLEASFNDLQYEDMREVFTTSVPGFMSQIGGQFGFFLGLSIITLLQIVLYAIHMICTQVKQALKKATEVARNSSHIVFRTRAHST